MSEIGPKLKRRHLESEKCFELKDGREHHGGLLGVTSDAKKAQTLDPKQFPNCDRAGYGKNRELAQRISEAYKATKGHDEHGPHFILAWRLYPNKEHPRWQTEKPHSCGCGCGDVAPLPGPASYK